MKQVWTVDELGECWTLSSEELVLIDKRRQPENRLGFAHQIKHYQLYARFLDSDRDVPVDVTEYLIDQVGDGTAKLDKYDWAGRSGRRHRLEILKYLGVSTFDEEAEAALRAWLIDQALPGAPNASRLDDQITEWLLANRIDRPAVYQIDRIIPSAKQQHERQLLTAINSRLDEATRARLDTLLIDQGGSAVFTQLRSDTGTAGLEGVLREIAKLSNLRDLALPTDILADLNTELIANYRQRAARESVWELNRHPKRIKYPLLTFYCAPRKAEIIDGLVDLTIQIVHQIGARAERNVVKELINDFVKVSGKASILFRIAEAVHDEPDGTVRDVVFPVAGEQTPIVTITVPSNHR